MKTLFATAAGAAALALSGPAISQAPLPPLGLPGEEGHTFRLPAGDIVTVENRDTIIRQRANDQCWLRYAAFDDVTGGYRYGDAFPASCDHPINQLVITEHSQAPGVATLAEMQASLGIGPLADDYRIAAATGEASPVSATVPEASQPEVVSGRYGYMPLNWEGDWSSWMEHQDMCDERYRTYDRTTDMFFAYPGVRHFCNLGLRAPD